MTENEALEMIKRMTIHPNCEMLKAFEFQSIVIKSLEDLEQYRAIGTVERLKHLEEYVDTINKLCADYSAIGTIDEFKALKEKSVAKKPIKINIPNTSWCRKQERYECPSCHKYLNFRELSYCCVCGQKLDWQ